MDVIHFTNLNVCVCYVSGLYFVLCFTRQGFPGSFSLTAGSSAGGCNTLHCFRPISYEWSLRRPLKWSKLAKYCGDAPEFKSVIYIMTSSVRLPRTELRGWVNIKRVSFWEYFEFDSSLGERLSWLLLPWNIDFLLCTLAFVVDPFISPVNV